MTESSRISRDHWGEWTVSYALVVIYASLVVGPEGFHFVRLGLADALDHAAHIRFVRQDSGQRADWVANLIMLAPLGYLVRGALSGWNERLGRVLVIAAAAGASLLFILAVKFAQLYFPPRTVTLNYILAQFVGALVGIAVFDGFRARHRPTVERLLNAGDGLIILLGVYTVWLVTYFLTPFDFVIGRGELSDRLAELPTLLRSWPGGGQSLSFRVLLVVADTLATVPVGMFLAVDFRERSFRVKLLFGFALMGVVEVLALLVLSSTPFAVALVYRTAGVALGLYFMDRLKGKDLRKRHYYLARYVPVALVVYAFLVTYVSGLWSSQWVTLDQAIHSLEPRQILPFWNYYIVSKAHAVRSLVAHAFIYAPIGAMIWVRRGFWSKGVAFSATLAFLLSLLMEIGRWLKPGLRPDFSDPIIAAAAAALAFKLMPTLWRMFEREATRSAPVDQYVANLRQAKV